MPSRSNTPVRIEELEKRRLMSLSVTGYNPAASTSELTTPLLAASSGITLSSPATYIGGNGQGGTYTGFNLSSGPSNLAIPDGIILTSGYATSAQGTPVDSSQGWGTAGDSDLSGLIGGTATHDANVITLTFTTAPGAQSLSFDLLFGSNEFPGSSYSDVFGAFLDGTQISFDNSLPIDVANSLVTYDNNAQNNGDYPGMTDVNMGVGYDWLTKELQTTAPLNTGITTHTLKLAIADAGDDVVDSGIFLSQLTTGTAAPSGPTTGTTASAGAFQVGQTTVSVSNTATAAAVVVDRVGGSSGSATVDYATSNGTAVAGTDYTATSGTVTFADGQTTTTIDVPLLGNAGSAPTTAFGLTLSNATGGATLGSAVTETVTLDNTQSLVQLAASTDTVVNTAGTESVTVERTGDVAASATVAYATADGTAAAGTDYTAASGTATFAAGASTATITVPLIANAGGAATSTFTVSISSPGGNGALGGLTTETVTEQNNNTVEQFSQANYTFANTAGDAVLTVTRTGNLAASGYDVDFATGDVTAVAGFDYTSTGAPLWFTSGQASQQIDIPLIANANGTPSSTFQVALGAYPGNVLGTLATATVTETNAVSAIEFSAPTYGFSNGVGSATVTVTRSGDSAAPASVQYATSDGTAVAGIDYTAATGTVSFAAGQTSQTFSVALLANTAAAPSSTFTIALSNPAGNGVLGSQVGTAVTEQNTQSAIQFAASGYTFANNAGTAALTLTRAGDTAAAASVAYATSDGTAAAGADYTAESGTVIFAANQTTATITIPLLLNAAGTPSSAFTVTLSNPAGNGVFGLLTASTVTLTNSNSLLQFAEPTEVTNSTGIMTMAILRTGNRASATTVRYTTSDGTAVSGVDYTATSGTLTFAAGQGTQVIAIPILHNPDAQDALTFNVTLSQPGTDAMIGALNSTVVTIANGHSVVALGAATYQFANTAAYASLTISRVGNVALAGSVQWATSDQTAVAGTDYTAESGTVNFGAGDSVETIRVPLLANARADAAETFGVTLSDAGGNALLGYQAASAVTLQNGRSVVQIVSADYSAGSSATSVTIAVDRVGNVDLPATVAFTTVDGTAFAGTDYTAASGTLDFPAGEAISTITVPVTAVATRYSDTGFTMTISTPGGNAVLGNQTSTAVAIAATPRPPVITVNAYADMLGSGSSIGTAHVAAANDGSDTSLIYTWQIISQPTAASTVDKVEGAEGSPAPLAIFAVNGTTAAKDTAVTYLASGNYVLRVTASDGVVSAWSDVNVTVDLTPAATRAVASTTATQVAGVQPVGDATGISGFIVTFNGPLDPTTAQDIAGYRILSAHQLARGTSFWQRVFGGHGGASIQYKAYPIASAVYNAQNDSVELTLKTPMPTTDGTRLVQVLGTGPHAVRDAQGRAIDGNSDGKPGGTYTYRFLMDSSKTLHYKTAAADTVNLQLSGPGKIVGMFPADGDNPTLFLGGADAAGSVLTGSVRKGRHGTGYAVLDGVNDTADIDVELGGDFKVNLTSPGAAAA